LWQYDFTNKSQYLGKIAASGARSKKRKRFAKAKRFLIKKDIVANVFIQ